MPLVYSDLGGRVAQKLQNAMPGSLLAVGPDVGPFGMVDSGQNSFDAFASTLDFYAAYTRELYTYCIWKDPSLGRMYLGIWYTGEEVTVDRIAFRLGQLSLENPQHEDPRLTMLRRRHEKMKNLRYRETLH